jgi:hypothetical protein
MKLPNAHLAIVEQAKIVDYLLDPHHQFGAGKARFFLQFGFYTETWDVLAGAFREHGLRHEVRFQRETPFGPRYEVEGELRSPDGRNPHVRTVWQLDKGQLAPRLITAYPLDRLL